MRFLLLFALLLSSVYSNDIDLEKAWSSFLSKPCHEKALKLALATRCDDNEKIFESDERLLEMETLLNDYTYTLREARHSHFTFQESIYSFLEKELGLSPDKILIHDFPRNILNPDRTYIYFIYSPSKELLAVVKGFHRKTSLARELSSLEKLYSLHPKFSTTTAPMALGKAIKDQVTLYLVAETPAVGKTIYSMVEDVARSEGEKRAQRFHVLKKAVRRHARALKELHFISFEEGVGVAQSTRSLSLDLPFRPAAKETLKKYDVTVPFDTIEDFYKDLENSVSFHYPQFVYTHGDLNWSNVFYDAQSDTLTYIDTVTVHYSINGQHGPGYGPREALRDYRAAFARLETGRDLLSPEELTILQKCYVSTYIPKVVRGESQKNLRLFWDVVEAHERITHNIHNLETFPDNSKKHIPRLRENLDTLFKLKDTFYQQ